MTAYRSMRDRRFYYASDAIEHIQKHNCAKGCRVPEAGDILAFGPGGNCSILAMVAIGDGEPIEELEDGKVIRCKARQPIEVPVVEVESLPLFGDES